MIGLPGETDADVLGIVETIKYLQSQCTKGTKHLAINCTISNFTPKPHTPFQWHTVSVAEFERKHELLRAAFKAERLEQCKYNITPLAISAMEDFIGRGDRSISPVIQRAWELGATNDGWCVTSHVSRRCRCTHTHTHAHTHLHLTSPTSPTPHLAQRPTD